MSETQPKTSDAVDTEAKIIPAATSADDSAPKQDGELAADDLNAVSGGRSRAI